MPVERRIYKVPFRKGSPSEWLCPRCEKAILVGVKGSFRHEETKDSKSEHDHPDWEPEWISYAYSCAFKCPNPQCEEIIMSVGTGSVEIAPDFDESGDIVGVSYDDYFRPTFFQPHLNIFKIPKSTPKNIRDAIRDSFTLFFASPSSASNHIRVVLELILDYLKVKKFETKGRRRVMLSLHGRIQIAPANLNDIKDLMFAVKWLGNAGSHPKGISIDDIMDAYDILEIILYELFEKKDKSVKKLAKAINKRRGPKK